MPSAAEFEIRHELLVLLNQEYLTSEFIKSSHHSFTNMVTVCESAMRAKIYPLLYGLTLLDIRKYSMAITHCEDQPFAQDEANILS